MSVETLVPVASTSKKNVNEPADNAELEAAVEFVRQACAKTLVQATRSSR